MDDEVLTTRDLLEHWREATRAAELAERLAKLAAESAQRADRAAVASEEIARMAERAARASDRAARSARQAAGQAATFARDARAETLADADRSVADARTEQEAAGQRYRDAERSGQAGHGS